MSRYLGGKAIKIDRKQIIDGPAGPEVINQDDLAVRALGSVTMDFNRWTGEDGLMLAQPMLRVRNDPRRIMFDLQAEKVPAAEALQWRIENFSEQSFVRNGSDAIFRAIAHWIRGEHSIVVWADADRVWTATE